MIQWNIQLRWATLSLHRACVMQPTLRNERSIASIYLAIDELENKGLG